MSEFYDLIDEYLGDDDALTDISVVVRRLWFYDFEGEPVRLWQGKGKLFTSDGNEWLGTIDAANTDHHDTPPIQDGRDGSSATYNFTLIIPDLPGQDPFVLYEALKADQSKVSGRSLICYLAVFKEGEALRPTTPISFFKELTMFSPKFSEILERDTDGKVKRVYKASIPCKDANYGRSNVPNGTYADTIQKRRAAELGVPLDRGSEFLALMANRTYQIP
jgi:hypothetical protein